MKWLNNHKEKDLLVLFSIVLVLFLANMLVFNYKNQQLDKVVEVNTDGQEAAVTHRIETSIIQASTTPEEKIKVDVSQYIEVSDSCGAYYEGGCLRVRSGPGLDFPVVASLRNGMVLKVDGEVEADGHVWYKVIFDEWLRYPERLTSDWYVAGDFITPHAMVGDELYDHESNTVTSTKSILVKRSSQKLYAYDGDEVVMEFDISTGLELTPTPRGEFTIFKKTPSRYMQGPLPYLVDQQVYDLPGVPWNLYFTEQGAVIHGAYWHNSFGTQYSHGCVNLPPEKAKELYDWAEVGMKVVVRD